MEYVFLVQKIAFGLAAVLVIGLPLASSLIVKVKEDEWIVFATGLTKPQSALQSRLLDLCVSGHRVGFVCAAVGGFIGLWHKWP